MEGSSGDQVRLHLTHFFIPRFHQRLRSVTGRLPSNQPSLVTDARHCTTVDTYYEVAALSDTTEEKPNNDFIADYCYRVLPR
jgi:hypothetical protein